MAPVRPAVRLSATMTEEAPRAPRPIPRWIQALWLTALLAVPIILWILPADHFDEGESMCLSVRLFDMECPACGSTRAVQHLHHAELAEAVYFHSAAPLIYGTLLALWCLYTYRTATRLRLFGTARAARLEHSLKSAAEARQAKKRLHS